MTIKSLILASIIACTASNTARAEQGDWIVRLRGIMVAPNESSGAILPGFPGEHPSVDNAIVPEVDFTYMLANRIGAELILATSKHHVSGRQALAPFGRLASAWVLPPTLTLQYHFAPGANVRPYVGAGVNYTIFYSEKASAALNGAVGETNVGMKNSFGYAAQAGVDIDLTERLFLNLDIKYIDMDTRVRLSSPGAINTVKVKLNPIVTGIGLGMRF